MKKFFTTNVTPLRRIALVSALHSTWFWVPIWVLYYRRFTGMGGVALLESLSMGVYLLMIIPGGMLSDWLGRKRLLILASVIACVGAGGAGLAPTFSLLVPFILLMSMAGGLYQASIEAIIYDTLRSNGREHAYEKVLGKMTTVRMLSCALSSALGGWMYGIDPKLPWFATSLMMGISIVVASTLVEPRVETLHDSFREFFKEAGKGLVLLFHTYWRVGIPLIVLGVFFTMDSSGLWDIQAVSFGYTSGELGILLTVTYIFLAFGSSVMPILLRRFGDRTVVIVSCFLYAVLWAISGKAFGFWGAPLLIGRSVISVVFDMKTSVMWNRMIPSSIRATTLSTIAIIRGIPYILIAFQLGTVLDSVGISPIVFVLSGILFVLSFGVSLLWTKRR